MGKSLNKYANEKKHKYKIIRSAEKLFELDKDESENLANKAGLSLQGDKNFAEHLRSLIEKSGCPSSELYNSAQVSERMFQHIKKGSQPSKETLIALAVSMGSGIDEIQDLLRRAGYVLSNSLPNDVIVQWMLKNSANKTFLLQSMNLVLHDFGLPLLMTREKYSKSKE